MGMLPKLIVLFFCINTFMYLGSSYMSSESGTVDAATGLRFQGDMFDRLLQDKSLLTSDMDSYASALNSGTNITIARGYNLSGNFSNAPAILEEKLTIGTVISFGIDGIKLIWAFALTLFNFVIAPITIFSFSKIPPFFAVIFGLPFVLLFVISLYAFIRSGQV